MSRQVLSRIRQHRRQGRRLDLDGTRDVDYARLANDYLVDALLCEAAAYLQNGRDEEGKVSKLERSYYMDAGFMSISDDEEARAYLQKQREIDGDDFNLALYVVENAAHMLRGSGHINGASWNSRLSFACSTRSCLQSFEELDESPFLTLIRHGELARFCFASSVVNFLTIP